LEAAQKEIKSTQQRLAQQQTEAAALLQEIDDRGASGNLPVEPTWQHAEEAFQQIQNQAGSMTQDQAAKLFQKGVLPGKFFGQKVKMSQQYLSAFKKKREQGKTIKNGDGRPMMLDEFQLKFIKDVIEYGQARNKSQLHIQVAMLMRLMMLIEHGYARVDELDKRITTNPLGNKRKRPRPQNVSNLVDPDVSELGHCSSSTCHTVGQAQGGDVETSEDVVGAFSKEQTCTFAATADDTADQVPSKSVLAGAKRRLRETPASGGESRDKPPADLIAALLEEFSHSNEKQAECDLLTSRQLGFTDGKPGWRIAHASRPSRRSRQPD
jgi:hypothetical protein